jgi:threonine/homoserine/homoserine lactone efflux protein
MIDFLFLALTLGVSAGFAPGPLTNFVIQQTLKHDLNSGVKVAFSPVIVDIPIVILSILLASYISDSKMFLMFVSLVGSAYLFYLAYENFKVEQIVLDKNMPNKSFRQGLVIGVLSPNPYLFWIAIGTPILLQILNEFSLSVVFAFLATFYFSLVGSKVFIAYMAAKSKKFLKGKVYFFIMKFLALLLAAFAVKLIFDAIGYIN